MNNIYISDGGSGRYRRFKLNGTFQTVAGLSLTDFLGDNGPATQAALAAPASVFRDSAGNLLIVDGARIRKVTPDGTIQTIAGSTNPGVIPDGSPAVSGQINLHTMLIADPAGNLLLPEGSRIRILTPDKLRAANVLHSATQAAGPVAPGLRIHIGGTELIPPGAGSSAIQAIFDGQPGGFLSIDSGGRIVTVVPSSVAGQSLTQLQLQINGAMTNALSLPVVAVVPGILSVENGDGTANADANPAAQGSTITVDITGDGGADPSIIAVFVAGVPAAVVNAPPADSSGIRHLTVQLPDGAANGASPLTMMVGDAAGQGAVQLWLQQSKVLWGGQKPPSPP